MTPDENWKETRVLAKDISLILGTPDKDVEELLKTIENLIVHKLVEAMTTEEISNKDFSVELPYLGTLVVSISGSRDSVSTNFVPRRTFYRKIRKACHTLESPLTSQLCEKLGEHYATLYEEGEINE